MIIIEIMSNNLMKKMSKMKMSESNERKRNEERK